MNATELLMEEIKGKYYFINEETGLILGEKNTIHVLLFLLGLVIISGILMLRKYKNPTKR